ncbi:MAG: enoyl-CoA hydratase/isomerase family protein [Myxococcales bacterium]|nr:enoyl-CoA hydratase/isomerase family protein [Myxococcales bacterium]MCB9708177.1 enoyl-CoA hydratase/isomerase family protein [Myxococcales bacterium]
MSLDYQGPGVSWKLADGVLEVALHHGACNELGTPLVSELKHLMRALEQRPPSLRAMLLHSELESGFCAGADLRELHRSLVIRRARGVPLEELNAELRAFLDDVHGIFDALDRAPFVTVAAVHGPAFGGGLELALVCDIVVADATARFCLPELRLGLIPGFGGLPRLQRDVGNAIIRDLLFTGRSINAERAHTLGLIAQRVSPGEVLRAARALCRQVCRFDPPAVARAKGFLKPRMEAELEREKHLFCELFFSPAVSEALGKFVERTDLRAYLP